ncbi:hypothetical protein CFC21_058734 [Triticum aestivum]|uniref:Uncharacterized protein n=2 Tax=Triticum aestivum TaxID=4565 RepID=A0A3B6LSH4_WHEAT|nr:putative UPF0481 protein At3g02645 [Triticum aestivum]KAF7050352.1 hypothetical protein CFC21_058734 [Triticum aestivum]
MAASDQQQHARSNRQGFVDESRWVELIRQSLREVPGEEEDDGIQVSVFDVPKQLQVHRPDAYRPQFIALGPYHHWHPHLYDMERYKIDAARRALRAAGSSLEDLVSKLACHERRVRAHYHRHLDFQDGTLSLMMLVDGAFLLEFLTIHHHHAAAKAKPERVSVSNWTSRMAHLIDLGGSGRKSAHGLILRDMLMLENQIPLFLLREIFQATCHSQSVDESTTRLTCMVTGLMKELCPLKMEGNFPEKQIERDIAKHAHLLELLYHLLVPKPKPSENAAPAWSGPVEDDIEEQRVDGDGGQEGEGPSVGTGSEYVMQLLATMRRVASRLTLNGGRLGHVMKPIEFAAKAPWKMLTGLPGISAFSMPADTSEQASTMSQDEEIEIPSVTELVSSGVRFAPTNGNLSTITFNRKTATLHLPAVTLDCNTEVVLRNLVAYESSAASGPLVFTRYTELMNGIIDTDDDVTHLRKRGVVINRMKKSDGEAAKLWNGMSRSVQHSKVLDLDAVIDDVNRYYGRRWSVKAKRFMRKYVLSSWKMLTFLATICMLLLTTLQAFCSVYTCSRWFGDVVVAATPTPRQ